MKGSLQKIFAITLLLGTVCIPTVVSAGTLVPDAVAVVADAPATVRDRLAKIAEVAGRAILASLSTAFINTITYATDRLAYDAAVYISSGGNADDPLFENRTAAEYFRDYGASVAGEALSAIDDTHILGNFSLCQPSSAVELAFKLGIQSAFKRPTPGCEWNAIKENWGGFLSQVAETGKDPFGKNSLITTKLADMYNPKSNDFSIGIQLYSDILNKAQTDAVNETLRTMFGGFFKDKTNFINGKVETPAELIQKRLDATMMASSDIRNRISIAALGDKDIWMQLAKHSGSMFTNTLLSRVTQKLYDGLFGNLSEINIDPFNVNGSGTSTAEDARDSFRAFLTASPLSIDNYSQLGEFGACPSSGKGLYNCVADSDLITAVARADAGAPLTIAEAIEEGLLNGSWPLIPSSDHARDQDTFCYSYGYCHGNIVKLRKARILSTGWELAAESTANSENDPVTLSEVVSAFHDCNAQGELDANHPWCHLIDPDWVLKYPSTQCKAEVFGEQLTSSVADERQEVCVDMPSCIDEDSEGNCTGGYGYCVREENTWRFRGESCPEYYASCTSYENPEGTSVDFLSNTTNSDNCTADNAGCLWYATQKEDDGTGAFDWANYTSATDFAAAEADADIYRNRIYFTAEVEECDAEDAGCRELVGRADGTTLNMVNNPSFETDADENGVPDGWLVSGTTASYSTDSSVRLDGTSATNPGATGYYSQPGIALSQGAEYTYSFYARQGSGTGASTSAMLAFFSSDATAIDLRGYALSGDCALYSYTGYAIIQVTGTPTDTTYERFTCTFTVPVLADTSAEISVNAYVKGGDLWFDEVQLEQESEASEYHDGYSSSTLDLSYVKVAPAYLGCTGDSATDPADCANYATMCSETDVGCSLYAPTNGDPSVAGIAGALDVCPETCVGYDTFKQEATKYEPTGSFPVYFIPDSAETCSAQAVGCDEFTNITTEAASYFTSLRACVTTDQAALNVSSSDDSAVFYTWEGSDTAGYQLKTWNLLESDMGASTYSYAASLGTDDAPNAAPCTSWTATATGITCNDDSITSGALDSDDESCDEHDDTILNPDCREFYDVDGIIHYRAWSQTVTVNDLCVSYRKTTLVGLGEDLNGDGDDDGESNCEVSGGFFDSSTSECRYYGYADESFTCSESESGCREYTGGRSRNSRQAFIEYFEDGDLTNWDSASATKVTLSNESVATDGHSLSSVGEPIWTYVGGSSTVCTETVTDEGCAATTGKLGGNCTIINGEYYCGTLTDQVFSDKTYTLSFWAKGTGTLSVGFDTAFAGGTAAIDASFASGTGAIALDTDWHQYTYGPLDMTSAAFSDFGSGSSALVFTLGSSTDTMYIDNVVLREGEDNIDVIKDSWVTPAECDETEGGASSPQYMLGCQEYTDQNSETSFLKSFSSLCEESQVGCSAYFMTQESDVTTAAVYGAICSTVDGAEATSATSCYYALDSTSTAYDTASQFLCTIGVGKTSCEFNLEWYIPATSLPVHLSYAASTVISPADKDVFLVVNDDVECSSDVAGCMEVGLPVFSQDHTAVEGWTVKYFMNTPADYTTTLCSAGELFCNAWTGKNNVTSYFKDPQNQTCEYRANVTVDNVTYSGWFKTGKDELCATDSDGEPQYVVGGDVSGIWKNGDEDYANWVGACSSEYDSCTEYQDLVDLDAETLYGDADGTSYFYLDNNALADNSLPDSQRCNGEVSQKEGCGLFNNSADPEKTSNMSATYVASTHADDVFGGAPNDMVEPIDCDAGDSSITTPTGEVVDLCEQRCRYGANKIYDITGGPSGTGVYVYDGSCYENDDCRPLTSESGESINGSCSSAVLVPRLENDANTLLKVNRDRQCSEWLSCSDAQTTWDEKSGSYKTICGDIALCTDYSSDGNASFCSAWKNDDPAVVLDEEAYANRDVSWYGEEYSGFALPNLLPVDQLTQKDISDPASESGAEYSLAYVAGACEGDYGDVCTVGYCSETGSPCASSDSCGSTGGSCVIGSCYTVSATSCASSSDCSGSQECVGGFCATEGNDPVIEGYDSTDSGASCASGETFYPSVNFKQGTCIRDECTLTPTGSTFDVALADEKECRGYPEVNSPFPTDVVTNWLDPQDQTETTNPNYGELPITYRENFENVKTCVAGEECDCSYKKVTYGEEQKYFGQDTDFPVDASVGICSGGEFNGAFCSQDGSDGSGATDYDDMVIKESECNADSIGTCIYRTKIDDVLGMDGYCLERDSSTNILGDRDLNACISWLPVDQLSGSTDLYAKYTEAGYFDTEVNYCSYIDTYATVSTSSGCLERNKDSSLDWYEECMNPNTTCPPGFFMVAGPYKGADLGGSVTAAETTQNGACAQATTDDDCPFMCVPFNSYMDSGDTDTCKTKMLDEFSYPIWSDPDGYTDNVDPDGYDVPRYWINSATNYDDAYSKLKDCSTKGVEYHEYDSKTFAGESFKSTSWGTMDMEHMSGICTGGGDCGWYDFKSFENYTPYMACKQITQVAMGNSDDGSAPWTDVLLNEVGGADSLASMGLTSADYPEFGYYRNTFTEGHPFGAAETESEVESMVDASPSYINQCRSFSQDSSSYDGSGKWSLSNADGKPTILGGLSCDSGSEVGGDVNEAEAGAFIYLGENAYGNDAYEYDQMLGVGSSSSGSQLYIVRAETAPSWTPIGAGGGDYNEVLNRIFAKSLSVKEFVDGVFDSDGNPVSNPGDGYISDAGILYDITNQTWDDRVTYGNPPSVWAVDMDNCFNDKCEEDQAHPLTVNDQNDGNISADGFYRAYLKFYAAADKNQLPIRRVIVDWGDKTDSDDQTGSSASNNFYKNHRGLQSDTEISICDMETTGTTDYSYEWGMNSESCDPSYFSYNHIYTCNPVGLPTCLDPSGDGIPDNAPCTADGGNSCTFRPRVHIRDNWGWCTGVCTAGTVEAAAGRSDTNGCFDEGGIDSVGSYTTDECNYGSSTYEAWNIPFVSYDGVIIVTP